MLVYFKSFLLRAGDAVQKVLADVLRSLFQNPKIRNYHPIRD